MKGKARALPVKIEGREDLTLSVMLHMTFVLLRNGVKAVKRKKMFLKIPPLPSKNGL